MPTFEHFTPYSPDHLRSSRAGVTVPRIWVTIALSVIIHALVLWGFVSKVRMSSSDTEVAGERAPLSVQLAPRPSVRRPPVLPQPLRKPEPQPTPLARATPPVPRRAPPKAVPRPEARPPVIALNKPATGGVPATERAVAPPSPSRPAPAADLAAYIEARRQARGEAPAAAASPPENTPSAPPTEDANARANRIAAANLGTGNKPAFGADKRRGGGVFQIQRMTYDYAEFLFYGWNKDIRRNTQQLIEVRKGGNSDIRIAVVRRMVALIREYEQGDFVWESHRLGRNLTLSARARDSAGLEEFMMREFFEDDRRP